MAEAMNTDEYQGNSVGWWHSKAQNYGRDLLRVWDVLRAAGVKCDGRTHCAVAVEAELQRLSDEVIDLKAMKITELSDSQVNAMFGGKDEADRAADSAKYVMKVAIREVEIMEMVREIQRLAADGLESGLPDGSDLDVLFANIHRLSAQIQQRFNVDRPGLSEPATARIRPMRVRTMKPPEPSAEDMLAQVKPIFEAFAAWEDSPQGFDAGYAWLHLECEVASDVRLDALVRLARIGAGSLKADDGGSTDG